MTPTRGVTTFRLTPPHPFPGEEEADVGRGEGLSHAYGMPLVGILSPTSASCWRLSSQWIFGCGWLVFQAFSRLRSIRHTLFCEYTKNDQSFPGLLDYLPVRKVTSNSFRPICRSWSFQLFGFIS